ncbi:unnamed protein product [Durusdinium trenchii]|uniref:Membrane insertase YidC/Oxa/ALB C-terminal domain-containing protein n=1 Tax=Durusdinium trenchii TaxID=1381693 RepID=A0ABP0JZS0_9DINO
MAQLLVDDPDIAVKAMHAASQTATEAMGHLMSLLGPVQPAAASDLAEAAESGTNPMEGLASFFFDPRLQWDENGNVLLDPQGNPLPDNLWTQFVAFQATLIKRLDEAISGLGIPQSFGFAVATYTLLIRTLLYPFVKGQLETTAKIQVLAPRVNELREKYKDDEERLQQEVGLLYMDLQVDPLGAVFPLLLQLPVFWGLYRAIRRLAIVEYPHLKEGFLWIPSLYGPNFKADPSFDWIMQWEGPLINLHPKIGWSEFGIYAILPLAVFASYRSVMSEALEDENAPALLQFTPFLLSFITIELPQAMGIYIATNIASSFALTSYTKNQISSQIPGYEEFVKTGEWPEGVDGEKVLEKAFGVKRLTAEAEQDPQSVPEAVFANRADYIPTLLENGRKIDELDDKGASDGARIPASMYTLALNNPTLLDRLFELGADPRAKDKRGNTLLHYASGYGRVEFLPLLLDKGLKDLLEATNEDGQTCLDVARVNLSQEKVADEVRPVIAKLVEAGAVGKLTTVEDEARFEKVREDRIAEAQVKKARDALKALAMAAQKQEHDAKPVEDEAKTEEAEELLDQRVKSPLNASLERVRSLSVEELRERMGDKMSEEQLQKLSQKLSTMSPEDLAKFAAGLPTVKAEAERQKEAEEKRARTLLGAPGIATRSKNAAMLHFQDWRGGVRRTAVDALARLFAGGLAKDTVLTKLVACIEDQDAEVRRSTARTLVTICPEGNQATLAALAGKIKGPLRELHALATEVLWTVAKPGDAKVIKLLSHLLQSPLCCIWVGRYQVALLPLQRFQDSQDEADANQGDASPAEPVIEAVLSKQLGTSDSSW